MNSVFYLSAAVAVLATALAITRAHAVHALLYLIVSLLALAVVLFLLGAPFVAALEVIIYAGAIMVLFVFVIMMLNLRPDATAHEGRLLAPRLWIGPALLGLILLGEVFYLVTHAHLPQPGMLPVGPRQVGASLFGPYMAAAELSALLLLAGLVGAYHLGRRTARPETAAEGPA